MRGLNYNTEIIIIPDGYEANYAINHVYSIKFIVTLVTATKIARGAVLFFVVFSFIKFTIPSGLCSQRVYCILA